MGLTLAQKRTLQMVLYMYAYISTYIYIDLPIYLSILDGAADGQKIDEHLRRKKNGRLHIYYIYIYVYVYVYVYIYIYMDGCIYIYSFIFVSVYIYTYVYIYMYIYIYIDIYIYIRKCTYLSSSFSLRIFSLRVQDRAADGQKVDKNLRRKKHGRASVCVCNLFC